MEVLNLDPGQNHADNVYGITGSAIVAQSPIAASWRRSLVYHGLNPEAQQRPCALTASELNKAKDRISELLSLAQPALDRLFCALGDSGCCVIMTDADGVVCDIRCKPGDQEEFTAVGLHRGGVWREETEGTNGIGTCLAEKQPVIVHRSQHFHTRNTEMSCIDAPIFDHRGRLIAALDVSTCRSDHTESNARIMAMVVNDAARHIEAQLFHAAYSEARIVVAEAGLKSGPVLLAIDQDDLIVGATRAARKLFKLRDGWSSTPRPANDVLVGRRQRSDISTAIRGEVQRALARSKGNISEAAKDLGIGRATMYRRLKSLGLR
ncbi:GAF domain-containing protein [Hoeflea sp. TYP-13]|uniref:GAF domain-containing protein n=1 Tax=Hoeflea sp. TYP-13 TaxID=3230023 RepID=UPI0034C69909